MSTDDIGALDRLRHCSILNVLAIKKRLSSTHLSLRHARIERL